MDFKNYYHNKLNEEGIRMDGLDADAPKPQAPAQAPAPQGKAALILQYVNNLVFVSWVMILVMAFLNMLQSSLFNQLISRAKMITLSIVKKLELV